MKRFLVFLLALSFLFLTSCSNISSVSNNSSPESVGKDTTASAEANSEDNTVSTVVPTFTPIHTGNYQFSVTTTGKTTAFKENYIYYSKFNQNDPSACGIFERSLVDGTERRVSIYPGDLLNVEGDYLFYRMPMNYFYSFLSTEERAFSGAANYKMVRVDLKNCEISLMNATRGVKIYCFDMVTDDKYVYYLSMDSNYDLRRMDYDGSNNIVVLPEKIASFYLSADKIYYLGAKDSSTEGINISVADYNGKNIRVIATIEEISKQLGVSHSKDDLLTYIHVYGDWIYFQLKTRTFKGFCRIKTDGSGLSKLFEYGQPSTFAVFYDKIFVHNNLDLYTFDLDGKNKTKLESKVNDYNFYGSSVYLSKSDGTYEIDLSNGKKEKIF